VGISTYAGAYRLNLLQETLPGTGSAENLPLAKNKNSHQCENCGVQLSNWAGQCPEWNCALDIFEVSRPIDPLMVKFQSVTVALARLA
jgi:hypothetical protein